MTVNAVLFDVGNVLVEWHPHAFFDSVIGEDRRRALFAEVDLDGMNLSVDRGAPFTETVYGKADEHPEWRDEIRLWHDRWIEMTRPEIPHSVRLMRALRQKGVPVFSLTNFGRETYDFAAGHYPFLREFDRDFISGHLGVLKPEPEIYAAVEEVSGLSPETLLFTDDKAANLSAASARGWQTHLFEGPDGWAARLVEEGLLDAAEAA